ncbi:MAG: hypothetical protein ACR2HK_00605 [Gemmatimonadales bacterium]
MPVAQRHRRRYTARMGPFALGGRPHLHVGAGIKSGCAGGPSGAAGYALRDGL